MTSTDKPLAIRRGHKQARSLHRQARIIDAAIATLASHGIAGLTHRLVARTAGVSLAATTYYFESKFDIVAAASNRTLQGQIDAFYHSAEWARSDPAHRVSFGDYVAGLIRNVADRDRRYAMCWSEIVLDAHRHDETLELAQRWFADMTDVWSEITGVFDVQPSADVAQSAIDIVIGLLMMTVALHLSTSQIDEVLCQNGDPLTVFHVSAQSEGGPKPSRRTSRKSNDTRERIIQATIRILIADGPGAVNYRSIAAITGLTAGAPVYHFPSIGELLATAQARLFEESKLRYRRTAAGAERSALDLESLIDRTAIMFVREATEFAGLNLASYAVWLQAARQAELRPMIWSAVADRQHAWLRLLTRLSPDIRPLDALLAQGLFIGKLVRVIATGSQIDDLMTVRREFAFVLSALVEHRFWLSQIRDN